MLTHESDHISPLLRALPDHPEWKPESSSQTSRHTPHLLSPPQACWSLGYQALPLLWPWHPSFLLPVCPFPLVCLKELPFIPFIPSICSIILYSTQHLCMTLHIYGSAYGPSPRGELLPPHLQPPCFFPTAAAPAPWNTQRHKD